MTKVCQSEFFTPRDTFRSTQDSSKLDFETTMGKKGLARVAPNKDCGDEPKPAVAVSNPAQEPSTWKVFKERQLAKDPTQSVEALHSRFKAMSPSEKVRRRTHSTPRTAPRRTARREL